MVGSRFQVSPAGRHRILTMIGVAGFVALILILVYQYYTHHRSILLDSIRADIQGQTVKIEQVVDTASYQVTTMRSWAENRLRLPAEDIGKPLLAQLKECGPDCIADPYFELEDLPLTEGVTRPGNIFGTGSVWRRDGDLREELQMAPGLFVLHQTALEAMPDIVWTYYLSAREDLAMVSPYKSVQRHLSDGRHESVAGYFREAREADVFQLSLPENNPARRAYWTSASAGQAGEGLMVSYAAPVYVDDRFTGTVAIDFSLSFIDLLVKGIPTHHGAFYVVNAGVGHLSSWEQVLTRGDEVQVLGSSLQDLSTVRESVPRLAEHLPGGVTLETLGAIRSPSQGFRQIGGYYVYTQPVANSPWAVIYLASRPSILSDVLKGLAPLLAGILVSALLLVVAYWLIRRDFVVPALQLAGFVEVASRDADTPKPHVPRAWQGYFDMLSRIFQENTRLLGALQDEVLRQTSEIHKAKNQAENYLHLAGSIIVALDRDGRITLINKRGCETLKGELREIQGVDWIETFIPERDRAEVRRVFRGLMAGEVPAAEHYENEIVVLDGSHRLISWHNSLLLDGTGNIIGVISSGEDVTDRKRAEAALLKEKAEVEKANVAKTRFLAAASHDLRQPLQAVRLFVASLEKSLRGADDAVSQHQLMLVNNISQSVGALSELLGSLLDISRLEAGAVRPEVHDFPVQQLFDSIIKTSYEVAMDKGLALRVVSTRAIVHSDPVLLGQILNNLVGNALRYTDSGRILLGCRRQGEMLRIEVWDTGRGIAEENQQRVFDEFFQLHNPARQRARGVGLGLAIVKRTADLLGHELVVHSWPGRGSLFCIKVPRVAEMSDAMKRLDTERLPMPSPDRAGRQYTVLVVEDDENVLNATLTHLASLDYRVVGASDAAQALARAGDGPIDAIIVDYRLPGGLSGIEACRAIVEQQGRDVPGILISGDTSPAQIELFAGSGLLYMAKPVDPAMLEHHLNRLLSETEVVPAQTDGAA